MPTIRRLKYVFCLLLLVPSLADSHPHSYITLNTEFYISNNALTKIHFIWSMDEFTSSYLKLEYQQQPEKVRDDLLANIIDNHYFSEFRVKSATQNTIISLALQPADATLTFEQHRAVVNFWLTLQQPISITAKQFELITYERTFYVDMYYNQDQDISVNQPSCQITLDRPTPDDKTLNYAQSLDSEAVPIESEDFVLGKLFAQKVILTCP